MDVQSLNYFSMAQRFLELKMGMAMSMTGNGLGRGQGQQGDTDFLPGRKHMLGVKYLVCSFPLLPFLLPDSSRWKDTQQLCFIPIFLSELTALQRCELFMKHHVCPQLFQEALSVLSNATSKKLYRYQPQEVTFLQHQGPRLPTAAFSVFIMKQFHSDILCQLQFLVITIICPRGWQSADVCVLKDIWCLFDSRGTVILNMHRRGDSKFEDTSVWFTQILQQGKEQEVINQPNFLIWF